MVKVDQRSQTRGPLAHHISKFFFGKKYESTVIAQYSHNINNVGEAEFASWLVKSPVKLSMRLVFFK